MNSLKIPVLLLIYKRPDLTKQLISSLSKIKPIKLYVVADGPKNEEEKRKVKETRDLIDKIDWECEIKRNYADKNMGLRRRVPSGIDWFFEHEEEGIILEDDLVPHPSFFGFCEVLLERYKDDERVVSISGNNFQFGKLSMKENYYFSRYVHSWGWATWKRAWEKYDNKMGDWPRIKKEGWLRNYLGDSFLARFWTKMFDLVYKNEIDSWAYVWTYSNFIQSGLTIIPDRNLVKNIGFGTQATHTKIVGKMSFVSTKKMPSTLKHPSFVMRNTEADRNTERVLYLTPRMIVGMITRLILKTI